GMLAPVVAVAPTTDVGNCWSVPPSPLPRNQDGSLASWVISNIHNNFSALLIAGALGLAATTLIALFANRGLRRTVNSVDRGTLRFAALTFLVLLGGWLLIKYWKGFGTRAHGFSAVAMFVFLIGAVFAKAWEHKHRGSNRYFPVYLAVGGLMVAG